MNTFACPLCSSNKMIEVRRFNSLETITQYKAKYALDVKKYFPEKEFSTFRCVVCDLQSHYPALGGDSYFYDAIQNFSFYYELEKPEFNYVLAKIVELNPQTVLEVGCGEGLLLNKIKDAFEVRGSEYSNKAIAKLKKANIQLDTPGDKYDFVLCLQVLEHITEVKDFLQHSVNKLNNDGYLLITVPNKESNYLQEIQGILDLPPHHMTQWSKKTLENISKFFSLDIVSYYNEPHRLEHFVELVGARRNKCPVKGFRGRILRKFGAFWDYLLAPYFFDHINYVGSTHGILLRKSV